MKHSRSSHWVVWVTSAIALILLALPFQGKLAASWAGLTPGEEVQAAWRRAANIGVYHYQTDIVQTTWPVERLENVGRSSRQDYIYVEGQADRSRQGMSLKLWSGEGRASSDQGAIEIKVEDGKTWGRTSGQSEWQEVDGATSLFAPDQDLLSYLAAAKNVTKIGQEDRAGISLARYRFELDGPAFARYMRDQIEAGMRRQGQLPPGLSLETAAVYADMSGAGEIWLDEQSLPLRLIIHAQFPPDRLEWVEAQITTDFSEWGEEESKEYGVGNKGEKVGGLFNSLTNGRDLNSFLGLGIAAVVLGLFGLVMAARKSRWVYTTIILLVIAAMLFNPILQTRHALAFSDEQHARQAKYEQSRAEQQQAQNLDDQLSGANFNPRVAPLTQARQQRTVDHAVNSTTGIANLNDWPATAQAAQAGANNDTDSDGDGLGDQLEQAIGANPSNPDTDGDGLSDGLEYNELGTDFTQADTDGDRILDGVEVQGFIGGDGQRWYLNPSEPDTNKDGRPDTLECYDLIGVALPDMGNLGCTDTDGDHTPDPFDFDNDNDGAPDKVDLSPEVAMGGGFQNGQIRGFTDQTFNLVVDSLTPNKPIFVDFQLRPVNPNHLWYSLSMLDWPSNDRQGQVQRVITNTLADYYRAHNQPGLPQDANGDMKLTPLLEIRIPFQAGRYGNLPIKSGAPAIQPSTPVADWLDTAKTDSLGIAVKKLNDRGDLAVYVPLNIVRDPISKSPVAFAGRMLYWLDPANPNFGVAHQTRLVWLISALVDTCLTPANDLNYDQQCKNGANWQTQIQTVHGYLDDWYLTGLEVREDHGLKVGVIFEDPNLSRPSHYESDLWTMAHDLEQTFLAGRQANGARDITIDEIKRRFDSQSNGNVDEVSRWGLPPNAFQVDTFTFESQSDVGYMAMTHTLQILTDYFTDYGQAKVATPTLLFVREEKYRLAALDMGALVVEAGPSNHGLISGAQATIRLDPAYIPRQTLAGMNWAPYRYANNTWQPYPIAEYWANEMQPVFQSLFESEPGGEMANKGRALLAQSYYLAMLSGAVSIVEKDGQPQTKLQPLLNTDVKLGAYYQYAKSAGSGVVSAVRFVYDFITRVIQGYKSMVSSFGDGAGVKFLAVLGSIQEHGIKGVLPGFLQSLLSKLSFKAQGIVIGLTLVVGGLCVAAWAIIWLVGKLTGNQVLQAIADYALQGVFFILVAKDLLTSGIELIKGVWNFIKGAAAAITKAAAIIAVITLVLTVIAAVGLFFFEWAASGWAYGSPEWLQALRGAIAAVLAAAIILAIGLIPYIGPFIVALIAAFDFMAKLICKIANLQGGLCNGISGMLQKDISDWLARNGFSSFSYVFMDTPERLRINNLKMSLADPDKGFVLGNKLSIEADAATGLYLLPTSPWYYAHTGELDSEMQKSTFRYQLTTTSTTQIHAKLGLNQMRSEWTPNALPCSGLDGDALMTCVGDYQNRPPYYNRSDAGRAVSRFTRTQHVSARNVITLTSVGLNQAAPLYLAEGFIIPSQSIMGGGSLARTTAVDLRLKFDVFPAALDGFRQLVERGSGSAALAWDKRFPTLCDADGDSLRSAACQGNDPSDLSPDSDGDGLSDFVEKQSGASPSYADTDQDGLTDYWEMFYHTHPMQADSDGDGLRDVEETAGWLYTFAPGQQIRVTSDPLSADSDSDGLTDKQEQVYGFNPQMPSTGRLVSIVSQIDDADGYVKPGQTIAYTATLENSLNDRYARGLLEVDLPVAVQNSSLSPSVYTLKPRESATLHGQVQVNPNVQQSQWVSLTNRAGAILADIRQETGGRSLWLHLDENEGGSLFTDASLWGNHGRCMIVNGASRQCPTAGLLGYAGQAVAFDGAARFIRLPEAGTLGVQDSSFTVMAWVKPNDLSGDRPILGSLETDINRGLHLIIRNGKPYLGFYGNDTAGNTTLSPYTWYHITWRYDKGQQEQAIFVDGVLDVAQTGKPAFQGDGALYLGRTSGGYFNGVIDELEIYPRALTAEEIAEQIKAPVLYLPFDGSLFDRSYLKHGAAYPMDHYPEFPTDRNGSTTVKFDQTKWFEILGDSGLDLSQGAGHFSMAMWIYPESSDHWTSFMGKTLNDSNAAYSYPTLSYLDRTLKVSFGDGVSGPPCSYTTGNDVLNLNLWQHLIVTFDGGQFVIYRDGQRVAAGPGSCQGQKPAPGARLYLGRASRAAHITFHRINVTSWEGNTWGSEYRLDWNKTGQPWNQVWAQNNVSGGDTPINAAFDFYSDDPDVYSFRLWEDDWAFDDWVADDDILVEKRVDNTLLWNNQDMPYRPSSIDWGTLYVTLQNEFFKGSLDDIRVYRYALSETDAQALYRGQTQSLRLQFDEAPGATRFSDSSGNMNDAACAAPTCPDAGLPGRANQAARFDGSDDYLTLKPAAKLGLYDGSFTVMAWVNADDISGERPILGVLETVANQGLHLVIRNQKPYMGFFDNDTSGNTTLSPHTWYHLAWRYDKAALEQAIFVNGALDIAHTIHSAYLGTGMVYAGRAYNDYFSGLLDDLVIVNKALSAAEIQQAMAESPRLNLHLDEKLGATAFVNASNLSSGGSCSGGQCPQAGAKGQVREALVLDGVDDYISLSDANTLGLRDASFSVAAWVKAKNLGGVKTILGTDDASAKAGLNLCFVNGRPTLSFYGDDTTGQTTLSTDQWYHLVWRYDKNRQEHAIFVNGSRDALTGGQTPFMGSGVMHIGQARQGSFFNGMIDELAIYDQALSDQAIQRLYTYQAAWYDSTYAHAFMVDTQYPEVHLIAPATHLALKDTVMAIEARGPNSGIAAVEYNVGAGWLPATRDGQVWMFTYRPDGAGSRTIQVRATDNGGWASTDAKTITVDNTPPEVTLDSALTQAVQVATASQQAWTLHLSGTASDAASGMAQLDVTVLDAASAIVGNPQVLAVGNGAWALDYGFTTAPAGRYSVRLDALDKVGNARQVIVAGLMVDGSPPVAELTTSGPSRHVISGVGIARPILQGTVLDAPYPLDSALHLAFEEALGGVFYDGSANRQTATCSGDACPTATAGKYGLALQFDGGDDHVSVADSSVLQLSTFSAGAWVKPAQIASWQALIVKGNPWGAYRNYGLWITPGALNLEFGFKSNTGDPTNDCAAYYAYTSNGSLQLGAWQHVMMTYDGSTLRLYLNGQLDTSVDIAAAPCAGGGTLQIGGLDSASALFNGGLDDVVIYNYALSAAQVQAMANPASAGLAQVEIGFEHTFKAAGKLLHVPFDEASGSTQFSDLSTSNAVGSCMATTCPLVGQAGKYGQALHFDGVDDYVSLGAAGDLSAESRATLSAWIYPTAAGSGAWEQGGIILNREGEYEIARFSNGVIYWAINNVNQAWDWVSTGYTAPLNQWTHIVLVYDAGQVSTYANGNRVHSAFTGSGGLGDCDPTRNELRIGGRSIAPQNWAGRIDDVRIYKRAFDAAEIRELYQATGADPAQWQPVTLAQIGQPFASWAVQTPVGLEGRYQIHLRTTDNAGQTLMQRAVWQGEIDTLAPRLGFTHTQVSGTGYYRIRCAAKDYNLAESGWVCPLTTPPQRTYQTAGWFTAATNQTKLAGLLTPLQTAAATAGSSMQACDLYGNCSTVVCGLLENCTQPMPAPPLAPLAPPLALPLSLAEPGLSVVLTPTLGDNIFTSTAPITLSGYVSAPHDLRSLTVTVGSDVVYTHTWVSGTQTATWTASWTPPSAGVFSIDARLTDGAGALITDTTRPAVYVDSAPPQISLTTTHITGQNYAADSGLLSLAGWVTDTAVARVEVRLNTGGWQPAAEPNQVAVGPQVAWRAAVSIGQPPLSDTYTLTCRAVDVAGAATELSRSLTVDVLPPTTTFTLTYTYQGREISLTAGDTITHVLHPTLTLRLDSEDASGLAGYRVEWRAEVSQTSHVLATYEGTANTVSFVAGEAQKLSLRLTSRDIYSNTYTQTYGPIYVDYSATPVYAGMEDATPHRAWLAERCNLLGVDDRRQNRAYELGGLGAAQELYASWNADSLRLAWAGADWDADGDLFIYLDTDRGSPAPGGSARVYNPYSAAAGEPVIMLPAGKAAGDSMAADYAIWVQTSQDATLLAWDGIQWSAVISPHLRYVFDTPYTHLDLPFADLGIAHPATATLSLLAFATEEGALRLWAVQPARNNLNSALAADVLNGRQQFVLRNRYQWTALSDGVCPAGQTSSDKLRAAQQSSAGLANVQASFAAEPAGIAYSVMEDNLYFAQDELFDDLAVDWQALKDEYCAEYPDDPECDVEKTTADLDFEAQEDLEDWMDVENEPVGDGQVITYTLTYANRGDEAATGLVLDVSTWGQVRLPAGEWVQDDEGEYDHLVLPLGDLAAGETLMATFTGMIDLEFDPDNAEGWATIDAILYDDSGSVDEDQIDWLYVDHEIDQDAPDYLEIQTPGVLGPGINTFRGIVRDQSAVPTITLIATTPAGQVHTACANNTPDDGLWACAINVGALDDGDPVHISLAATDVHGQVGSWPTETTFIVDSTPPSVTLNAVTQAAFADGVIGPRERAWGGGLSDNRLVDSVQVCDTTSGQAACAEAQVVIENPPQTDFVYEDMQSAAIGAATACDGGLVRTFTVSDSFTVGDVNVGLNFEHTYRDDVYVYLTSPAGTEVELLADMETEAENLDVLFDDASPIYLGDDEDDHDTAAPYYENIWSPSGYLSDFNGEDAAGDWQLTICDADPGLDDGLYQRSALILQTGEPPSQTMGDWQYALPTPDDSDGTAIYTAALYGQDSAGNRSTTPLTLTYRWDSTPPVITVSAVLSGNLAAYTNTVLHGSVSDGSRVDAVFVSGYTPQGDFLNEPAALTAGGDWSYDLRSDVAGDYTLWVYALDQADNQSEAGPFRVKVSMPPQLAKAVTPTLNAPLGGIVTYTLTVSNPNTESLSGLVITDQLPIELSFITQTTGAPYPSLLGDTLSWGPYTLDGGAVLTIAFTARLTDTTTYYSANVYNTATLANAVHSGRSAQAAFSVESAPPAPILTITKTAAAAHSPARLGDAITYTIVLANVGDAHAVGVVVTDTLPSGVSGDDLSWTGDIHAGASITFTLPAHVAADSAYGGQIITNTAYAAHSGSETRFARAGVQIESKRAHAIYLPAIFKSYSGAH